MIQLCPWTTNLVANSIDGQEKDEKGEKHVGRQVEMDDVCNGGYCVDEEEDDECA